MHNHSSRCKNPFVTINCAGLPESLLESELFGYERGAFTGAVQSKAGKIELAHGGTLFLDEIESISVVMQGKLLRVLEDQKVQRLGGSSIHVDMRVITATNIPLKELVAAGKMRSDFYYRVNVIPIHLIPLHQRKADIPLLAQHFIRRHPVVQKGITSITKQAMRRLLDYPWPGNIRELQNVLERAIVLNAGGTIHHVDLSGANDDKAKQDSVLRTSEHGMSISLKQWLVKKEKEYLRPEIKRFGRQRWFDRKAAVSALERSPAKCISTDWTKRFSSAETCQRVKADSSALPRSPKRAGFLSSDAPDVRRCKERSGRETVAAIFSPAQTCLMNS